jgi:ABC-2 type transport system ATP-binding protein
LDVLKDAEKVREIISYLPEEAGAYKNMTGESYLRFMAELFFADGQSQDESFETARGISDLGERLGSKIGTYSKGMTRKLLLSRALMTRPKLAILDEPTSGLDVINALEIRNTIREFAKRGMSVLLSSHNMLEIEYLSDRVAIIDKGRIHEIGTPAELKERYNSANLEEVFAEVAR